MRVGAHESVAGGLQTAFEHGLRDDCEAIQIFTSYNSRWGQRELEDDEVSLFRSEIAALAWPVLSHGSYLINLASPNAELWDKSLEALYTDFLRCEELGVDYLVLHPGSPTETSAAEGIVRVGTALSELHARTPGFACRILLENTAGQGNSLGWRFEQLRQIFDHTKENDRLGVCIDTCHAFAAGYDLNSAEGYGLTMEELNQQLGFGTIKAFHLNDSLKGLGSRVDRHASIGQGRIDVEAFARLVNEPHFATCPAVVETPPDEDGNPSFARNIALLKRLRKRA